MAFKDLTISFILIGIFVFSLLSISITLTNNNNSNNSILNETSISESYGNLSSFYGATGRLNTDINASQTTFEEDKPTDFGDGITLTSIVSVGKTLTGTIKVIVSVTLNLIEQRLGVPKTVIYAVMSIIVLLSIVYLWRLIRVGE
jgi:hypothetical protein